MRYISIDHKNDHTSIYEGTPEELKEFFNDYDEEDEEDEDEVTWYNNINSEQSENPFFKTKFTKEIPPDDHIEFVFKNLLYDPSTWNAPFNDFKKKADQIGNNLDEEIKKFIRSEQKRREDEEDKGGK